MNKRKEGKTVYVLGAGCSHHAGVPLAANFWDTALEIAQAVPELKSPLNRLSEITADIKRLPDAKQENFEELFAFLEVAKDCGIPAGEALESLLKVLAITIGQKCKEAIRLGPDPVYAKFVEVLVSQNASRGAFEDRHLPEEHFYLYTDTVVTFNYDILLDNAFASQGCIPYYALVHIPVDESFFEFKHAHPFYVLKPHGSLNWLSCSKHSDADWAWAVPQSELAIQSADNVTNWTDLLWRSIDERTSLACPKCCATSWLRPVLVAPGYKKSAQGTPLEGVWNTTVHEMYRAEKLVFIGYSLPSTDFDLINILRAAASNGSNIKKAEVVNLDKSAEIKCRYQKLFQKMGVENVEWKLGLNFEQYIENAMAETEKKP